MKSKKKSKLLVIITIFSCFVAVLFSIIPLNQPNEPLKISGVYGNISKNDEFSQYLDLNSYNTDNIVFRLATYGDFIKNVKFKANLMDSNNNEVATETYNYSSLSDGKYIRLKIPEEKRNLNGNYKFSVKFLELEKGKNLAIYLHDINEENLSEVEINNKAEKGKSLYVFVNGYKKDNYWFKWGTIISTIFMFCLFFCYAKKKKINLLKNIKIKLIFYIVISGVFALLLLLVMKYSDVYSYGILFRILFLVISYFMMWIFANCLRNEKITVEKIFLLLSIPLGMMYCIYVLPFEVPDSQYHYTSAYQALNLNYSNKKIILPKIVRDNYYDRNKSYQEYIKLAKEDYSYQDLKEFDREMYNPVEYLFVSCGIAVGKILNLSPYVGVYIAKIFQYLSFICIGYLIIKITPYGKKIFLVYMLSPMFLQQATSISIDATINIFSLLFISKVLQISSRKDDNIGYGEIILSTISLLFAALQKWCYLPLGLLVLVLFPKIKKMEKKKIVFTIGCILILLFVIVEWFFKSDSITVDNTANTFSNATYIMKNPLNFIYILINDISLKSGSYLMQSIGSRILWGEISTPIIYMLLYVVLIAFAVASEEDKIKNSAKINFFITFCISTVVIELAMYVLWTTIGGLDVEGIQGRYYIPINILLLLILMPKKCMIDVPKEKSYLFISFSLIAINLKTILLILDYFI